MELVKCRPEICLGFVVIVDPADRQDMRDRCGNIDFTDEPGNDVGVRGVGESPPMFPDM